VARPQFSGSTGALRDRLRGDIHDVVCTINRDSREVNGRRSGSEGGGVAQIHRRKIHHTVVRNAGDSGTLGHHR
jgi:hypothetical protein